MSSNIDQRTPTIHQLVAYDMRRTLSPDDESNISKNIIKTPFSNPEIDIWTWDKDSKSCDVRIFGENHQNVIFHPSWSCGTSAIRGTKILNNTRTYWEISLPDRVFGTSLMFGIGTKNTRLGSNTFTNLIGEDENGWGLSHKGLLWHDGKKKQFCRPFRENFSTTVGLLFDGIYGTLSYFKDGVYLGVAFRDLNKINEPLYPTISSTSARTFMMLQTTEKEFVSLQDRCKVVILENVKPIRKIKSLPLPSKIQQYLMEAGEPDDINCSKCEWYVPRF